MREYHYRVDRDGRIFHDETEIVDPLTLRFFMRALTRAPDGRWLVTCQGEQNWFAADGSRLADPARRYHRVVTFARFDLFLDRSDAASG